MHYKFLLLLFLACLFASPVIAEPTRITGPLTAEGYIDFFKALKEKFYPPELATDDNGFRLFVRTFGDVGELSGHEFYRLQKYEKLGLDPNVPPTLILPKDPLKIFDDFKKARGEKEVPSSQRHILFGKPWTLEDYPMLADWVKDIDKPLDAIAEMIRKPVFFLPPLQSPEFIESGMPQNLEWLLLPDVLLCREIARMFQARAGYRIGQGDMDGAIDDQRTILRLGRLLPQGGGSNQHLVCLAIESIGQAISVGANPEHLLTEQQVRRILDGLDALPPRIPLPDVYEWERHVALSAVQSLQIAVAQKDGERFALHFDGGSVYNGVPFSKNLYTAISNSRRPFQWDRVYQRVNEIYDFIYEPPPQTKLNAFVYGQSAPEMVRTWGTIGAFTMFSTPGAFERYIADLRILAGGLDMSSLVSWFAHNEAVQRSQCAENMQRLALAMMLYRLENGEVLEENWAAQIEKYLGEEAEQYFSCPTNPAPKGETTYALVWFADTVGGSLDTPLLIELTESVPLDKAVVSFDEVSELIRGREVREGNRVRRINPHVAGTNVAYSSGAVRLVQREEEPMSEELQRAWEVFFRIVEEHGVEKANELLRALVREVQEHGEEKTIELLRSLRQEEE